MKIKKVMNKKTSCFIFVFCALINLYCQTNDIIKQSINNFTNKDVQQFNSTDYKNKNNGISFTMNYPSSYSSKDGIRPHILKQYTSEQDSNGGIISSNIQINQLPAEMTFFSNSEIAEYMFSDEFTQEAFPDAKILYSKQTKYEGQQGHILIYTQKTDRAGMSLNMLACIQRFIYKNCIVTINTFFTMVKTNNEDLEKKLQSFLLLNSQIGNSIVLMKY